MLDFIKKREIDGNYCRSNERQYRPRLDLEIITVVVMMRGNYLYLYIVIRLFKFKLTWSF